MVVVYRALILFQVDDDFFFDWLIVALNIKTNYFHQGLQEEKTKKENKLGDLQKNVNETKSKVKIYRVSEFFSGVHEPPYFTG